MGSPCRGETVTRARACAEPGITLGVHNRFYLTFLTTPWDGLLHLNFSKKSAKDIKPRKWHGLILVFQKDYSAGSTERSDWRGSRLEIGRLIGRSLQKSRQEMMRALSKAVTGRKGILEKDIKDRISIT